MKVVLLSPWRGGTTRRLCTALGLIRKNPDEWEKYDGKNKVGLVFNWGTSRVFGAGPPFLNPPSKVSQAANKLSCYKALCGVGVPTLKYTQDPTAAAGWLKDVSLIAHFDLHGHSGHGLQLIKKGSKDDITKSKSGKEFKVWTRYFSKSDECRVHCIRRPDGSYNSFYLLKKRVLKERYADFNLEDSPETWIRTYDNGWIFARQVTTDLTAVKLAHKAMDALELSYGAVDIMSRGQDYVVGEVNTAPGLEGQCLDFYVQNLGNMLKAKVQVA